MDRIAHSANDLNAFLQGRGMPSLPLELLVGAGSLLQGETVLYAESANDGGAWHLVAVTNTQFLALSADGNGVTCWSRPVAHVQKVSLAAGTWRIEEQGGGHVLLDAAWTLEFPGDRATIPFSPQGRNNPEVVALAQRVAGLVHTKWDLADDAR